MSGHESKLRKYRKTVRKERKRFEKKISNLKSGHRRMLVQRNRRMKKSFKQKLQIQNKQYKIQMLELRELYQIHRVLYYNQKVLYHNQRIATQAALRAKDTRIMELENALEFQKGLISPKQKQFRSENLDGLGIEVESVVKRLNAVGTKIHEPAQHASLVNGINLNKVETRSDKERGQPAANHHATSDTALIYEENLPIGKSARSDRVLRLRNNFFLGLLTRKEQRRERYLFVLLASVFLVIAVASVLASASVSKIMSPMIQPFSKWLMPSLSPVDGQNSGPGLVAKVGKNLYHTDEIITVSGITDSEVRDHHTLHIRILDPSGSIYRSDIIDVSTNGSYKYEFVIPVRTGTAGPYTVVVFDDDNANDDKDIEAKTTFQLLLPDT